MDAFIGEIRAFANTFYPMGWLPCNGDRVSLQEYQALFSIIGANYGPTDNHTYFTLPNLRGTALVGAGRNPQGALDLSLGKNTGTETVKHDRGEADKAGTVVKCDMDFFVQCRDNRPLKINMLFFQDSYIASYQCSSMGFNKGDYFS